jgi:hypothetical protein
MRFFRAMACCHAALLGGCAGMAEPAPDPLRERLVVREQESLVSLAVERSGFLDSTGAVVEAPLPKPDLGRQPAELVPWSEN